MPRQTPSNLSSGQIPTTYDPNWAFYNDPKLTPAQIAAFQAFPQDLTKYTGTRRWQKEICSTVPGVSYLTASFITIPSSASADIAGLQITTDLVSQQKIAAVKQAFDNGTLTGTMPFLAVNGVRNLSAADITALYGYVVRYVQATYVTAATLLAGINASPQTITTRAQVDAAFAAIVIE
jgi:hypothetical protein